MLEELGDATLVRTEQSWWGPLPRFLPGPMGNMLRSVTEERLRALKAEVERMETGKSKSKSKRR